MTTIHAIPPQERRLLRCEDQILPLCYPGRLRSLTRYALQPSNSTTSPCLSTPPSFLCHRPYPTHHSNFLSRSPRGIHPHRSDMALQVLQPRTSVVLILCARRALLLPRIFLRRHRAHCQTLDHRHRCNLTTMSSTLQTLPLPLCLLVLPHPCVPHYLTIFHPRPPFVSDSLLLQPWSFIQCLTFSCKTQSDPTMTGQVFVYSTNSTLKKPRPLKLFISRLPISKVQAKRLRERFSVSSNRGLHPTLAQC